MGCPGCNFSYCSKCLKKSIEVPRHNNKKHHVCLTCFDRISKECLQVNATSSIAAPVDCSAIDEPLPPESTSLPTITDDPLDIAENSASADDQIKERLAKLKEDRILNPTTEVSDKDIAIRIANLKGERFLESSNDRSILMAVDNRSDEQKTKDLVAQYMSEAQLDEDADPIKDIERRLAALKGSPENKIQDTGISGSTAGDESGSENEEDQVKRLVGRYLEEASLEPAIDGTPVLTAEEREFVESIPKAPSGQQEELPWCVICNEDATIRYQGDLFCRQCYREVREDE